MRPLPLLVIMLVLCHVAANGCRVTVALFAIDLKSSAFTIGALLASFAVLPALLSVRAGRWIDRIGIHKPFLIGAVACAVGVTLPALLPSVWTLYATCMIVGTGFMFINVAAYHAVGEMSTAEERPTNFSYVALGFSTSSFIAPILSGLSIDALGHRATFVLLALFTVLPVVALSLKLLPAAAHREMSDEPATGAVFDLLTDVPLRRLFIVMTILTVSWDVYAFAIPVYGSAVGLSASQIGIIMGSFAAATFTIRLAMPFIAGRVHPWTLLKSAMVIASLAFFAMPFTVSVPLLMAIMFAMGLGLGAPQPMVLTLLHESAPRGRAGEALGLRTTLINGSQTVMPLVFGVVGAAVGMTPLFWGMAVALLGGGFFAQQIREEARAEVRQPRIRG